MNGCWKMVGMVIKGGKRMNYMKQVAQMLGVELGEEFYIYSGIGELKCKINDNDLLVFIEEYEVWEKANSILADIITGKSKIKKPILDEVEKRYLSNVIKPFRNRVKYIAKYEDCGKELIYINLEYEEISLPYFEPNTMYKGMELDKGYTLEELGL